MKNFMLILGLTLSMNLQAEDLDCTVKLNTEVVSDVTVTSDINSKVLFAEIDGFRFYITNKNQSKFEIEVFNAQEPSRSYASGVLKNAQDELSWSVWSRDYLVESFCSLAK